MSIVEDFTYSTLYDIGRYWAIEDKVFKELPVKRRTKTKPKTLTVCEKCGYETMTEPVACPKCGSYRLRRVEEVKTNVEMYFELVEDPWGGESVVRSYYPKAQFRRSQVYQMAFNLDRLWKKKFAEWQQLQKVAGKPPEETSKQETDWERNLREYFRRRV